MLPFINLILIDRSHSTPVYLQIANRLIQLITEGLLQPGSELPSSRMLAEMISVHRKTVVAAYNELISQDWIESIPRKGVIVSLQLPEIKPRTFKAKTKARVYSERSAFAFASPVPVTYPSDLNGFRLIVNDGLPDARIAPTDSLMSEYKRVLQYSTKRKAPPAGDAAGSDKLRNELCHFFADTRGLRIHKENVLITRGAQMAIYLAAQLLLKPGAVVLVGNPNYYLADLLFRETGATIQRVPVDENGMDVNWIAKYCEKKKPDLLYIIPHHHHPTTATLSAGRRLQLLELIRRYRFPVIEDDYDYDFHYNSSPILPLASADHSGFVIYIGSLTKALAPGFRVGYMIANPDFIFAAMQYRRILDIRGDQPLEDALAALFVNGDMQRHLKKSVKLYRDRRDIFCDQLDTHLRHKISFSLPTGGMAVWVRFSLSVDLIKMSKYSAAKGLYISDGRNYSFDGPRLNGLRMGFASFNEKEMKEAIKIIAASVNA
jgi:GntR family transcriptional regulator/MocR family aminotransferase